jgi:hypothetical protein
MIAVGDWVLVEPLQKESDSGILSSAMDRGKVIGASRELRNNGIQLNKIVIFDLNKVAYKHPDFWAIDFKWVFAIQ